MQQSSAPEHPLSSTAFYSVEYPGYVKPTSVPLAVHNLGGQVCLDTAFKRTASKTETLVELKLRPGNPFAHPVPGDVVSTNNILLKVVKRKRRLDGDGVPGDGVIGEYMTEVVGIIPKTVRFRSMVDYQYLPDMNDPVTKLRIAMDKMDVESIANYAIPIEREDYTVPINQSSDLDPQLSEPTELRSNLRMFPPPLFSRQGISQNYNYKANPASMVSTTVDEETGEEKKRLINKMRWKGYGPASIMFTDHSIPDQPPAAVEKTRTQVDQAILKRLQELFVERPIWTRMSLFNQFTPLESREIHNSKVLLPLICYVFQDGPWRDTLVRFGYDPRKDVSARFYQRLYFRNANHPIARTSVIGRHQDRSTAMRLPEQGSDKEVNRKNSHLFDGVTLTKETAAFQLCDIVDSMLKEMIEDPNDLREVCNERDGWYTTHAFERIKIVLRHKFFSLLEGHAATDDECLALLVPAQGQGGGIVPTTRSQKLRAGKHNMAKGALRPEDAAAARLRAMLERNAKSFQSQNKGDRS